jgi:hypothetical protein
MKTCHNSWRLQPEVIHRYSQFNLDEPPVVDYRTKQRNRMKSKSENSYEIKVQARASPVSVEPLALWQYVLHPEN